MQNIYIQSCFCKLIEMYFRSHTKGQVIVTDDYFTLNIPAAPAQMNIKVQPSYLYTCLIVVSDSIIYSRKQCCH